ncbi:putative AT DNA binding protein [Cladochytrium replicatum]|nr:putative AT DNA binding protein [Cladochytrium replicatum]
MSSTETKKTAPDQSPESPEMAPSVLAASAQPKGNAKRKLPDDVEHEEDDSAKVTTKRARGGWGKKKDASTEAAEKSAKRSKKRAASEDDEEGADEESTKTRKKAAKKEEPAKPAGKQYWLMKSEPDSRVVSGKDIKFSIDDFEKVGTTLWDGVRSLEGRKYIRSMQIGDQILFYHSNCRNPGVAGIAEIVEEATPDNTAFDKNHPYYDAKSDPEKPKWDAVRVKLIRRLDRYVSLAELKKEREEAEDDKPIKEMKLFTRPRLSVQPVDTEVFQYIVSLETRPPPEL